MTIVKYYLIISALTRMGEHKASREMHARRNLEEVFPGPRFWVVCGPLGVEKLGSERTQLAKSTQSLVSTTQSVELAAHVFVTILENGYVA